MRSTFLLVLIGVFYIGCQSPTADTSSNDQRTTVETPTAPSLSRMAVPSIPLAELQQLYNTCDFIDFIFFELPFSMSYDNAPAIQTAIKWVAQEVPLDNPGCKALARMSFQSKGGIVAEADIYVSDNCAHLEWIKEGKTVYANKMSPAGHQHYMKLIQQFNK